ncbi:serine hydrolase [Actinocrispum sp. NPDC049592]|uniref:serine hydrolase n=1 Tax=Actinocrispum sp. NPDC049592 TaxID=3154835 RepID=UPI00343B37B4
MSGFGRKALVSGLVLAAVVLVAPTLAEPVTPAGSAVEVLAPPPIPVTPTPAPAYAQDMIAAGLNAAAKNLTVGAAVLDMTTGDLQVGGSTEFYSASLSKLMLVVDMLDRDDDLSTSDEQWISRALSLSDDNAMNALWSKFDGPDAMTRVAASLGMTGTETPDHPSQWGETVVSPAGFARLYQHILSEMDESDRDQIVEDLSAAQPAAADGYHQFFGLLGQPAQVYAKQGWMYYGDKLYLHSAGVVHDDSGDYVVVLMTVQPVTATTTAQAAVNNVASAMLKVLATTS